MAVYNKCKVYGVEPSEDQVMDFANFGTVIPYAVGVEKGASLRMRNPKRYNRAGSFTLKLRHNEGAVYREHVIEVCISKYNTNES